MSTNGTVLDPDARVRLGVIGAGWFVSRRHLPDAKAKKEVTLTSLCRRDSAARAKMEAHFGLPEGSGYDDWRAMLDRSPLDAVLIATPNSLHFEQAKAASAKLTLGQFHDALRTLHDQRTIYLHPWTGPIHELPHPAASLLVGHEIAYYASLRS